VSLSAAGGPRGCRRAGDSDHIAEAEVTCQGVQVSLSASHGPDSQETGWARARTAGLAPGSESESAVPVPRPHWNGSEPAPGRGPPAGYDTIQVTVT
jgi:hypothetical protein